MFCGLDFGTSHCAVGVKLEETIKLIPLENDSPFMPSTLYAFDRGFIVDYVHKLIAQSSNKTELAEYQSSREASLNKIAHLRQQHDLTASDQTTFVGSEAISEYIEFPEEGYFVKSPKSFLGAKGLQNNQIQFFEDITTALMLSVKHKAELKLGASLSQVVIGRPVNFQGLDSQKSNQQAIEILTRCAKRCGFSHVDFLYEPLAAGIDFETQLSQEKVVLVVDIGGGTTDCSIVKMGPNKDKLDREEDFLAHTGRRIGGNDLDIYTAFHTLMPLFGLGSEYKTGATLPRTFFWNAVATNDVVAQNDFVSNSNRLAIEQLSRDAKSTDLIQRLIRLQADKLNHRVVRDAELAKIALSQNESIRVNLNYVADGLEQNINQSNLAESIQQPKISIQKLIKEALIQANTVPDIVYITGGSAKSQVLKQAVLSAVKEELGMDVELLDGDYFGSVASGLTKWAEKIYR